MRTSIACFLLLSILVLSSCTYVSKDNQIQDNAYDNVTSQEADKMKNSVIDVDYLPQPGDVASYGTVSREELRVFLQDPSMASLQSSCNTLIIYRKSDSVADCIESERLAPGRSIMYADSGVFRIGSWPVYTEFIDYMSDIDNFRQILSERDINEDILSCTIFTYSEYSSNVNQQLLPGDGPKMCIWIHSDEGDYFLVDNPYYATDPHDTNYTYDFYDTASFIEKLGF